MLHREVKVGQLIVINKFVNNGYIFKAGMVGTILEKKIVGIIVDLNFKNNFYKKSMCSPNFPSRTPFGLNKFIIHSKFLNELESIHLEED